MLKVKKSAPPGWRPQLYAGAITNPRDLESLEQEASHARDLLKLRDDESLELAVQAEEAQTNCVALEKKVPGKKTSAWQNPANCVAK